MRMPMLVLLEKMLAAGLMHRRGIIARTKSFYQQRQRISPSFSHISTSDREELHTDCISRNYEIRSYIHNRFLMTRNNSSHSQLSRNVFQLRRSEIGVGYGLVSHRSLSSASGGERVPFEIEIPNDTEVLSDTVGVVGDKAAEAAPMVNEVAGAAADSFSPVAALQHLVDYVHCYTGFNWWTSIVVTTLLFRFIVLPINIHSEKFISKYSDTHIQPLRSALARYLKNMDDPSGAEEGSAIVYQLVNKYGKIPILGFAISFVFTFSFFFAILNMAGKVPSFITGGTLWFTDLTTSDRIRLPILLALTVWVNLKLSSRRHVQGQPAPNKFLGALTFLGAAAAGFPNLRRFSNVEGCKMPVL
ncbi:hypothetical protein C2S51_032632 [Perilla frutescens var. frutescens]|nr:hypothetical protein C2S51_032632 [Perilla frutescens var. frutescens]